MSLSRQRSKLQEAKAEVASLLKVLTDKVELERKFGADFVQLAPVEKSNSISVGEVDTEQPDTVSNPELSKAEKVYELKKLEE